jgi:hypothetical protein
MSRPDNHGGDPAASSGSLSWLQSKHVSPGGGPESPIDEGRWHFSMQRERERWRARAHDPALKLQQRLYATCRVAALERRYVTGLAACETKGCFTRCQCAGAIAQVCKYTCGRHWLCAKCQSRRTRRNAPRIRKGIEAAYRHATGGGWRRNIVLITLTVRHDGGPKAQRDALARGWRRLYKRMSKAGWGRFPYVGVYEATPGKDGLGHVHVHIVAIMPFRPWDKLSAWWREACPESSNIDLKASQTPHTAHRYIAKYVTKGVQSDAFTPALRADILAAFYGKRCLFSSTKFFASFVPACPHCGCRSLRTWGSIGDLRGWLVASATHATSVGDAQVRDGPPREAL